MRIGTIGLTGGIGSGKSTVASLFVQAGAYLVDTDAIARQLTVPGGPALPALTAAFGNDILDAGGALDRERMRTLVFADHAAKLRLESLLHPLIGAEAEHQAGLAGGRPVVFDVPLMTGASQWRSRVDRVVVVDCPAEVQVDRVVRRSHWQAGAANRVIAQQLPRASRRELGDAVIDNGASTSLTRLSEYVAVLWAAWVGTPAPLWNNRP